MRIFNATPHDLVLRLESGKDKVLETSGRIINARILEMKVDSGKPGIGFVTIDPIATDEGWDIIASAREEGHDVIVGSYLAAQAYRGAVVAPVVHPDFVRASRSQKMILPNRFTVFLPPHPDLPRLPFPCEKGTSKLFPGGGKWEHNYELPPELRDGFGNLTESRDLAIGDRVLTPDCGVLWFSRVDVHDPQDDEYTCWFSTRPTDKEIAKLLAKGLRVKRHHDELSICGTVIDRWKTEATEWECYEEDDYPTEMWEFIEKVIGHDMDSCRICEIVDAIEE